MLILLKVIGYFLISIGAVFLFLGSLGLIRMPDLYNRIQAGTKATTLGALSTIIGVGLIQPSWFLKTLIIALFIVMTNPIGSQTIARSSIKNGIKVSKLTTVNKYNEDVLYNKSGDINDSAL